MYKLITMALFCNGEPVAGTTGFVFGYSSSGDVNVAFSYAEGSRTGKETFAALLAFDEDLVAAGATTGAFADKAVESGIQQPILARISLADSAANGDENPDSWDIWRVQPDIDGANITALANYRDDEIVTLVRETVGAANEWKIVLFSGEGERLN